jgi:hypothetical protein
MIGICSLARIPSAVWLVLYMGVNDMAMMPDHLPVQARNGEADTTPDDILNMVKEQAAPPHRCQQWGPHLGQWAQGAPSSYGSKGPARVYLT